MIIGIDVGGTHTDAVLIGSGVLKKFKTPSADLKKSVILALEKLIDSNIDIERISISTTLVTNSISKGNIEKAGIFLICDSPLSFLYENIIPYIYTAHSYIDHRGEVIKDLYSNDLSSALEYFISNKIKNIGVVSKFSPRNPVLEKKAGDFFRKNGFNVVEGSTLSGKLDFPRRIMTTYLSSSVYSIYRSIISDMESSIRSILKDTEIMIVKADGGVVPISDAIKRPVDTILSGPAASIMGSLFHLKDFSEDFIIIDTGGTTSDIGFFINSSPVIERDGISINNYKTLVRALKVFSMPLGGDSVFNWSGNELVISNVREGIPYCFGGPRVTVTDLALFGENKKSEEGFIKEGLIDKIKIIEEKIISFIESYLKKAISLVNSRHIYTIKEFFENRVFNPKKVLLVGGAAPYFKRFLDRLGYEVIIPKDYEVCNAIGAALARPSYELNLFANTLDARLSIPEIDYYEKIDRYFDETLARKIVFDKLKSITNFDVEIVEEEVFNMVRGFNTIGKNIRIVGQVKPGLII